MFFYIEIAHIRNISIMVLFLHSSCPYVSYVLHFQLCMHTCTRRVVMRADWFIPSMGGASPRHWTACLVFAKTCFANIRSTVFLYCFSILIGGRSVCLHILCDVLHYPRSRRNQVPPPDTTSQSALHTTRASYVGASRTAHCDEKTAGKWTVCNSKQHFNRRNVGSSIPTRYISETILVTIYHLNTLHVTAHDFF